MSVEKHKLLIRRYIEEIVNTGAVDRIAEFISPDYVEVHDNVRHEIGIEGAIAHVSGVREVYPDLHVTIERQIAEGAWVASVITARGTHQGAWAGIAPTGKTLVYTGVNVDRVVDGLIVEHGGAANMLGPLLDAGAIRAVGE